MIRLSLRTIYNSTTRTLITNTGNVTARTFSQKRNLGFVVVQKLALVGHFDRLNTLGVTSHRTSISQQNCHNGVSLKRAYSTSSGKSEISSQQKLSDSKQQGRMAIVFTCKVCNHRQTKTFAKTSYEKGVVIIQCDGCDNRHLIADNLGWFDHVDARNIEDIMRDKGEEVKKYSAAGMLEFPKPDSKGSPIE